MDGMHQVPAPAPGHSPLHQALSELRQMASLCVFLELTVQSALLQEDRLTWLSENVHSGEPVRRVSAALADFCDESLCAYLSAVVNYTAAAAGVWSQLQRGEIPDVDSVPPARAVVEDLRRVLSATPVLPEKRRESQPAAAAALDALARRLAANELPLESALDQFESPEELALREVVQRLHAFGQDCHWTIYAERKARDTR